MLLRSLAWWHRLVGILILELIKRKRNAAGKPHGFRDRLRDITKQPCHLMCRLQMAFGIGFKFFADTLNGRFLADAGEYILQGSTRGMMVQHLIGRQQGHAGGVGDALQSHQAPPVIAAIQQAGCKPDASRPTALQLAQNLERF